MTRRDARISAMKLIFQIPFQADEAPGELIELYKQSEDNKCNNFTEELFLGVCDNLSRIDEEINKHLQNWTFERLSKCNIAVLRLAAYEIIFTDIPMQIAVNEAVEISKLYGDFKSPAFINGVLGKLAAANGRA